MKLLATLKIGLAVGVRKEVSAFSRIEKKMKQLDSSYTIEVDKINKDEWHSLMVNFDDASFYQTWSYGAIHSGEKRLSHLILKKSGKVVGMSQARIYKIPALPLGTAYVNCGPMWRLRDEKEQMNHLRNLLRGLYNEYVVRRGLLLRVSPKVIANEGNSHLKNIYAEEGFSYSEDPMQTVLLDLTPTLEDLRKNLSRSWRRSLKTAEEQRLELIEGNDDSICEIAQKLAREMKDRKKFYGGDQDELILAHKDLPEALKLKMLVSLYKGEPIAALGWSTMGKIGMPLVAGTGNMALTIKASFLLWWKMIEDYKVNGFLGVDVAGVSEERNPGGYLFKTGLMGKRFKGPDHYIGQFDACRNPLSEILFKRTYGLRDDYRNIRRKMAKRKKRK